MSQPKYDSGFRSGYERNRIIFGAPGTGKSFLLKQEAEELIGRTGGTLERVTFHPDYTYAQFVGTYKPISDAGGTIRYDFVPGPFLRVYVDALRDCQPAAKIRQAEVMYMFPTNRTDWYLFEGITEVGQTQQFDTPKDSRVGDPALIYVARSQDHSNGIYALGTIAERKKAAGKEQAIIRFDYISYDDPIIDYETLKSYDPNIRSPGQVNVGIMDLVRKAVAKPHLLLIEEINRAKVAAVFGDVFQLLDRDENGVSEYGIHTSEDVRRYLASELSGTPEDWTEIKLPDNLFIWATMNSADQGVFPMDTAFKRRWDFEYIGINEREDEISGITIELGGSVIEWNRLRKAINDKLAKEYRVNEDKLMGPFFLDVKMLRAVSGKDAASEEGKRFTKCFKSKVIMYLYEDAARQYRHKLFAGCEDTTKYSAVCDSFDKIGIRIFGEDFEAVYYDPQEG